MTTLSFNLDTANKTISDAMLGLIRLMLPMPDQEPPTREEGQALMKQITEAMTSGSSACAEVTRLRDAFAHLRDQHRPQPNANSDTPGAICATCSLHGGLITWPCETWTTAEKALTHGQS